MTPTQVTFTYTDPRYFDGDPFEVAVAAVRQADDVLALAERALTDANVMARNAEMERRLYRGEDPDAAGWADSPQGRQFGWAAEQFALVKRRLTVLRNAAGFNPRHPPKE